jgi:hypothetical protein
VTDKDGILAIASVAGFGAGHLFLTHFCLLTIHSLSFSFLLAVNTTMALRISAKRAAAMLKPHNASSLKSTNFLTRRNASQATAVASNLEEGTRDEIYVRESNAQLIT